MFYDIDFMNTDFSESLGYYTGGILNVNDEEEGDIMPKAPAEINPYGAI
ncbi:hypothetical protein IC220_02635 [Wolbachia endosymbiont of Pentalonia nigronervosa]|jgi:hypothetical protein|nr:hypothetical protein [Wolbachia endosymbiont of Pentalonia nigronervosa]MBD0391355.1 hypothetical protein [Wolbachia endosymbiont of Pentalonia nigronervosa]